MRKPVQSIYRSVDEQNVTGRAGQSAPEAAPEVAHNLQPGGSDHEDAGDHERIGVNEARFPVDVPAIAKRPYAQRVENCG